MNENTEWLKVPAAIVDNRAAQTITALAHKFNSEPRLSKPELNTGSILQAMLNFPGNSDGALPDNPSTITEQQLALAIHSGRHTAERAKLGGTHLFIADKTHVNDVISISALACALFNNQACSSTIEMLCRLGGLGIARLTGSYLSCAHIGLPMLIDGAASAVAALTAVQICPEAKNWFIFYLRPPLFMTQIKQPPPLESVSI